MLTSETNFNSNSVGTQQNQHQNGSNLDKVMLDPSNPDVVNNKNALQKRLAELFREEESFSKWPAKKQTLAVSAASGLFTAVLPLLAVGAILAIPGAIVGLALFFAYKAVEYTFKGLKWSAEKTVEGAKYTAEKVKDASTYAAGKVRDGAVHVKDKIKSSTSHVVHNVSQSLDRLSSQTNYSDAMLNSQLLSGDAKDKIVSIKEQLMGIFNDKEIANKDKLLKKILKDIVLQIESKKDHAQETDSEKYAPEWGKQINFIKDLNAEKLHDLLTKQSLPKDTYFLYTIFSEHHDEIKRIIGECKTEHKLSNSIENLNKAAGKYGIRKGSTENSLSKSSSLSSISTDSTATVSDSGSQNFATVRRSSSSSSLGDGSPKSTPVDPQKVPGSPSTDSGFNSPTSSPVHGMFTEKSGKSKTQDDLNLANHTLWEQPSTKVDEVKPESTQAKTVG